MNKNVFIFKKFDGRFCMKKNGLNFNFLSSKFKMLLFCDAFINHADFLTGYCPNIHELLVWI